jgi:hypothetical protein
MRTYSKCPWSRACPLLPPRLAGNPRSFAQIFSNERRCMFSCFEAQDSPFDFKEQHDFDLLEADKETLLIFKKKGHDLGMEVRGVSDHGIMESIIIVTF